MNTPSYIDAARLGKPSLWRYLAGLILILFIWLGIGSAVTAVLFILFVLLRGLSLSDIGQIITDPNALGSIPNFLILNVSFILFFAGVWLAVVLIHKRPFRTVATGSTSINWMRIWRGFILWLILAALASLIEFLIWPETFSIQVEPVTFVVFAILALILTPIQTTSEEIFFRGYLMQAGSMISRNAVFLSLLSGVLFTLPHIGNPEVSANAVVVLLSYFVLGVFLTWISIKDGTIELAIGLHAANNLFAGLVVTFPQSALQTPALFYTTHFDPIFNIIVEIIICALFYLLAFGWRKRDVQIPVEQLD